MNKTVKYVIGRLLFLIPIMLILSFFVFALTYMSPLDPVTLKYQRIGEIPDQALIGTFMSAGSVALISLVLYFGIGTIGRWFISSRDAGEIIPLVTRIVRLMCPFYFFYSFAEGFSGACCGTGDTVRPMITTLSTVCLLRVLSIWLILPRFGSIECITWIYIASWIAAGAAFTVMFSVKIRALLRGGAEQPAADSP